MLLIMAVAGRLAPSSSTGMDFGSLILGLGTRGGRKDMVQTAQNPALAYRSVGMDMRTMLNVLGVLVSTLCSLTCG